MQTDHGHASDVTGQGLDAVGAEPRVVCHDLTEIEKEGGQFRGSALFEWHGYHHRMSAGPGAD
jgi:hypothetical protein